MPGYNLSFSYLHNICIYEHIKETWNTEYIAVMKESEYYFHPKRLPRDTIHDKHGEIMTGESILCVGYASR